MPNQPSRHDADVFLQAQGNDRREYNICSQYVSRLKKRVQEIFGGRPEFARYIKSQLDSLGIVVNNLVDIGCGSGAMAIAFAEQNPNVGVLGCDVDTFFGGKATAANFKYISISPFSLSDILEKKTDVITAAGVMHHIEPADLDKFLLDVHGSLVEGGIFVIHEHRIAETPVKGLIDRQTLRVMEFLNTRTLEGMTCAYNFFKASELRALLAKNNFTIISEENTEGRFVTLPTINGNTVFICKAV